MTSETRRPFLQYCVICDAVGEAPGSKDVYVGVFDQILRPTVLPQFAIVVRWIDGIGTFKQSLRILNPRLEPLVPPVEQEFTMANRITPFTIRNMFGNIQFEQPGVYWVELHLNDEREAAIPLPVYSGGAPAAPSIQPPGTSRADQRATPTKPPSNRPPKRKPKRKR